MLQLDPTTQASLEAAATPNARAAAILSALSGTITITVRDGAGATKGSGTMASFGTQSANVIVLNDVTSFTVSETGTPDPATWTIEFANAGGRSVKGTFGLYTSPVAEFKWSLDSWENGQSGTIASAYCTVRKNEVLSDATDEFNVTGAPTNTAPVWLGTTPTSLSLPVNGTYDFGVHTYDPDEQTLVITKTGGPGTITSSGVYTAPSTAQSTTLVLQVSDGIASSSTSVPTSIYVPSTGIVWNPGHGIKVKDDVGDSYATMIAEQQGRFFKFNSSVHFKYVDIRLRWGRLNPVGNTYDWSAVDSHLAAANALGKKVAIGVNWKSFQNGTSFLCPSDLVSDAIVTVSGYTMAMWRPNVMDRFLTFWQAFGARYNNDPRLAFVTWAESASSLTTPFPSDYSRSALATQLKRLYAQSASSFTNTVSCAALNSLSGELTGLLEEAYRLRLGMYTPDTVDSIIARIFRGETVTGEDPPAMDYRTRMAYASVASQPALGGKDDNGPPSNIVNWAQTNQTHFVAWYATADLPAPNDWNAIVTAIDSDPLLPTTLPTNLQGI